MILGKKNLNFYMNITNMRIHCEAFVRETFNIFDQNLYILRMNNLRIFGSLFSIFYAYHTTNTADFFSIREE